MTARPSDKVFTGLIHGFYEYDQNSPNAITVSGGSLQEHYR